MRAQLTRVGSFSIRRENHSRRSQNIANFIVRDFAEQHLIAFKDAECDGAGVIIQSELGKLLLYP